MKLIKLSVVCMIMASMAACTGTVQKPTLFLAGDSTMADKDELEASPERGWGQVFPTFLDTSRICVQNHARNGRSTKSFIDEGRWDNLTARIKPGDFVIIQFGHNDQKKNDSTRYSDLEAYKANLSHMVQDVRDRQAMPILATSVVRRYFVNDTCRNTLEGYPEAMRETARELDVALIDMNALSGEWLQQVGEEASKDYYMHVQPGTWSKFPDGKTDDTHFNEAGALVMAGLAAQAIRELPLKPLDSYLLPEPAAKPVYTVPVSELP